MADQAAPFLGFGGAVQVQTLDARADNNRHPDLASVLHVVLGSDSDAFLERDPAKDLSQLELGRNSARSVLI